MFGLFQHRVLNRKIPLVRGFDDVFLAPHSRHTEVPIADIHACKDLTVLAESEEAGLFLAMAEGGRKIFVMGHPEYDRVTLVGEYKRDLAKGLPIEIPKNYYKDDVTKTYRKSVTKMLEGFDSYFAYCCGRSIEVKLQLWLNFFLYVRNIFLPQIVIFHSYHGCSGGNWGEDSPNGVVKKIMKTGSKTYEVTYNLYFYNWMTKKNYGYMGTYKIYLKKANNKNGFIITNIKQTVNKKNSL